MTVIPPNSLAEADYQAIEMALITTEKGRGFLRDYLEQNRPAEARSLLRSISRLHRATVGAAGLAGLKRDLGGLLCALAHMRGSLEGCPDDGARACVLLNGLHEIEAALIALVETMEEGEPEPVCQEFAAFPAAMDDAETRAAKLYGELSQLFAGEPGFGPDRCRIEGL